MNGIDFDLRITFTGLCLYVRETRRGAKAGLHVLLPDPGQAPAGGNRGMQHSAVLYYDPAYERSGAELGKGTPCAIPLGGSLDLSGLVAPAPATTIWLPDELLDADALTGSTVHPRWVEEPCGGELPARVFLLGAVVSDYQTSGPWTVGARAGMYLVWRISFVIPVTGFTSLSVPDGTTIRALNPIGGVINLAVRNVVTEEQHPDDDPFRLPKAGSQEHVRAFGDLYRGGAPIPVPRSELPIPAPTGMGRLGSLITCAGAKGSV